jgi:DNA-directed RNA polymerase specialized sigma24 family protein
MDNQKNPQNNDFDSLLAWLSENREDAGVKYEEIRQGLIRFFYFKGCRAAEDLADETINRVTKKLTSLDLSTGNKPITIFYGFASKVVLEEQKREKREQSLGENLYAQNQNDEEFLFECLETCLQNLTTEERELCLKYYEKNKSEKIEVRRKIAETLGLSGGTLQVKIHRIRLQLRKCIEKCLSENNR